MEFFSKMYHSIKDFLSGNPEAKNDMDYSVAELKTVVGKKPLTVDSSFRHDLTEQDKRTWRPVAVTHFSKDGKDLYYINAQHEDEALGDKHNPHNATYETIRAAFRKYGFKAVVIEGKDGQNWTTHEEGVASNLAREKGIPIIGGEPSDKDILEGMKQAGYNGKDQMGFYLMRVIPYLKTKDNFATAADEYLQKHESLQHIPENERLKNFDEFKQWYKQHAQKEFDTNNKDDLAPIRDGTELQKMAYLTGKIREESIDPKIMNAVNEYGSVLVVYGAGHLIESQPKFEQAFGGKGTTEVLVHQESPVQQQTTQHTDRINNNRSRGYRGR